MRYVIRSNPKAVQVPVYYLQRKRFQLLGPARIWRWLEAVQALAAPVRTAESSLREVGDFYSPEEIDAAIGLRLGSG